jgi:DNA-binding response OmpR family regulator
MRSLGWAVDELATPLECARLAQLDPDALIVDLDVAGVDAAWLARQIASSPDVAIVAFSECSSVAERVHSLQRGLDGWIEKPCDPSELLARVQAIARARQGTATAVRTSILGGELEVSPGRYDAIVGDQSAGLTTREFEVLELLARHSGVALERERIYTGVWGDAVPAGDRSVDIFVGRIRLKLKRISPEWAYVHTHSGVGYRFAAERLRAPASEQATEHRRPVVHREAIAWA